MTASDPVIHVVDDDDAFRRSLIFLLEGMGWTAVGHPSAEHFLAAAPPFPDGGGCLVLDIRMPRMSGLELQRRLRAQGSLFPVVFITGHGDVELAVQAMKDGAADFLQKPFKDQAFLDAIAHAVEDSLARLREQRRADTARGLLAQLSPREREVAKLLALGLSNKEVARSLGISEHTVHVHRQHAMDKTGAGSAAEFARMILRADPAGLD